jgi:metallo-beta-lactamase family protein
MRITFYGAAQEVTGSMHMIEVNGQRILLDCGMYQGRRDESIERNTSFPFDPKTVHAVVLSHAHIDHSGNIPNLVKRGFDGHIWSTSATRDLCAYMLLDSGHIQEADVEYLNKRRRRAGQPPVEPLYTRADAETALGHFIGIGLHRQVPVADGVSLSFYNAGHILGSAFVALDIQEASTGKHWRLIFSGDVGRRDAPILCGPETVGPADIVIMESTYGDRLHGAYQDARRDLQATVQATACRRGRIIIPAFAVGRTQELVFALNELESAGDVPALPVYVDSPLAVNATEVFRMHPEEWDQEVRDFLMAGSNRRPFDFSHLQYIQDASESKRLNYLTEPAIIISASGMCEHGRILHHLANNISNADNTILFVGYQAENTLGRKISEGASSVRIFDEAYPVRAQIVKLDGYSAHADQQELLAWAEDFDRARLQRVFVVHGEATATEALAGKLREAGFANVDVPTRGQSFDL